MTPRITKLALAISVSVAAMGAPAAKDLIGAAPSNAATVTPFGLYFDIANQNTGAELRISGPNDFSLEQQYDAGQSYDFPLAGLALANGSYSFELVTWPDAATDKVARTDALTGSFSITQGVVADPLLAENATKDQVILDDLIVNGGSACVGQDCVNGESFGFDTIRMKENNLRLHFDDTSTSASFPSNDWRIVANDSSNGGGNFLAIEDSTAGRQIFRVDAGAPADSLRVDSAGDVGIGTSNPIVEAHVVDGDSPTLRLEQNGSSGFTPQTFDIASNESNFFVRDVTNGSQLPFKIKPGADSDSLVIAANNNIGVGTLNPAQAVHIARNGPNSVRFEHTGAGLEDWEMGVTGNGTFKISEINSGIVEVRFSDEGIFTVTAKASPPTTNRQLGSMYNDTSGALCWWDGSAWLVVVGSGSCS